MNMLKPVKQNSFVPSAAVSPFVNDEMHHDSFFHPNLGGVIKGGMSNHYPMTIMSLAGLGANDDEIKRFRQTWPKHRSHVETELGLIDKSEITLDNWKDYLGQTSRLLEFRRVFTQRIVMSGAKEFVTEALEQMKLGLPMGLFHPLIQLSFAVIHGDNKLIANALAYFAIRYKNLYRNYPELSLSDTAKPLLSDTLEPVLLNIKASSTWADINQDIDKVVVSFQPSGGSLYICEQLCGESTIQQLAFSHGFMINEQNLKNKIAEISQMAIRLYLAEPALTTLHAVTACQALADLTLRFGTDKKSSKTYSKLWSLYWIWLTGLYLEKGFPADLPCVKDNKISFDSWEIIAKNARNIPEVHLIKMVYSCKWLYENIEHNELYRVAAMNILKEQNAHPTIIRWTRDESL
ncbi:MAG: hypothetical protein ACI9LM_000254 [Alteromonadaceae bacterium]|jgi:hypothetical protein